MGQKHRWFTRQRGGDLVPEGVYWNLKTLQLIRVTSAIDFLPSKQGNLYVHLPLLLAPMASLLLGLLYILALPLAPFFIAGWLGAHGLSEAFNHWKFNRFAANWN